MEANFQRKYQKTIAVLLYLASKEQRLYWVLKMIWFAERNHLSKYGMMISGDNYIAMSHGPVPSLAYDIVKDARGGTRYNFSNPDPKSVIEAPDNRTINACEEANISLLSETERECLDEAFQRLSKLSFIQVKRLSHTPAHEAADEDDEIPFEEFVKDLDNGPEVLNYLSSI